MKVIKTTYLLLNYVFIAWLLLSWLDVVIHNTAPGGVLHDYNMLALIANNL